MEVDTEEQLELISRWIYPSEQPKTETTKLRLEPIFAQVVVNSPYISGHWSEIYDAGPSRLKSFGSHVQKKIGFIGVKLPEGATSKIYVTAVFYLIDEKNLATTKFVTRTYLYKNEKWNRSKASVDK